jgi:phage tail protein X
MSRRRSFVADVPADADVAVLLAERARIEAALPGSRRTYLKFADGDWSGCNLFHMASPDAARALDLWARVEADRKRPWRIVRRFGLGTLARYAVGRLTLAEAVARLGRTAGVTAAVVAAQDGLAAVDVDKVEDLVAVRGVLGDVSPTSRV